MIDEQLRDRAVSNLEAKAVFTTHLVTYTLVNAMLIVIWALSSGGFFWPVFPLMGWGIGLALHSWFVYAGRQPTEDRIQREMDRLRG